MLYFNSALQPAGIRQTITKQRCSRNKYPEGVVVQDGAVALLDGGEDEHGGGEAGASWCDD